MATTTKKPVAKKPTVDKVKDVNALTAEEENEVLKQELEQQKAQMNQIQAMMQQLLQAQSQGVTAESVQNLYQNESIVSEIKPNEYIKVMSLTYGELNLTTATTTGKKVHTFNKFGDVKRIVYSELVEILHNQFHFAEDGLFYIFDRRVIEFHGLVDAYEKILDKDTLVNILDKSRDEVVSLFKNASLAQKETIQSLLVDKLLKEDAEVDYGKIDAINRHSTKNILTAVEELKWYQEQTKG
jgi:hypothetical protein